MRTSPRGELSQPGFGNRKVEEDAFVAAWRQRGEGLVEPRLRLVSLPGDEFLADVVCVGELSDGLCAGECVECELLSLRGGEGLGGDGDGGGRGLG